MVLVIYIHQRAPEILPAVLNLGSTDSLGARISEKGACCFPLVIEFMNDIVKRVGENIAVFNKNVNIYGRY